MTIQYAKKMVLMILSRVEQAKKEYGESKSYFVPISQEQVKGLQTLIQDIPEERLSKAIDAGLERCIASLARSTTNAIDMIDIEKLMKE